VEETSCTFVMADAQTEQQITEAGLEGLGGAMCPHTLPEKTAVSAAEALRLLVIETLSTGEKCLAATLLSYCLSSKKNVMPWQGALKTGTNT
jgi:hypothetical protein